MTIALQARQKSFQVQALCISSGAPFHLSLPACEDDTEVRESRTAEDDTEVQESMAALDRRRP